MLFQLPFYYDMQLKFIKQREKDKERKLRYVVAWSDLKMT